MSPQPSMPESFLVYGVFFLAGLAVVILSSVMGFTGKRAGTIKKALYYGVVAAAFLAAIFTCLYVRGNGEYVSGIFINKSSALVPALFFCFLLMTRGAPSGRDSAPYILLLSCAAAVQAAIIVSNITAVLAAFALAEISLSAALLLEPGRGSFTGVLREKAVCFLPAVLFAAAPDRAIQSSGVVVFMMLMSAPGMLPSGYKDEDGRESPYSGNAAVLFLFTVTSLVITARAAALGSGSMRPVMLASLVLIIINTYKSITEENYGAFVLRDFANIFYMTIAALCGTSAGFTAVLPVLALMGLSAICQQEFLASHNAQKYTVTKVRYGFGTIRSGGLALTGIVAGLAAEFYVISVFYFKIKQDPVVLAIVMFMAAVYAVAALNKVFIMFSMVKRINIDRGYGMVFNKDTVRPAVFAAFAVLLFISGLK